MSEEEIMQTINNILRSFDFGMEVCTGENYQHFKSQKQAIQGLLDLYNKEKEKNKELDYKNAHEFRQATKERDTYWKDKIENKIKEYKEKRDKSDIQILYTMYLNYMDALKDLLKEEE